VKITREDVLRVAELAHLELSTEEVEMYRGQLDEIVSYVGKLQEIDVSAVEATAIERTSPASAQTNLAAGYESEPNLRDDVEVPCHIATQVLDRAPDAAKPFFRVPKVIER
jgi:aspartyl-tRNA(Asn)/glutamyl-tRNA(Gln) amidotransferase subunit C